jgi:hypothetical protein
MELDKSMEIIIEEKKLAKAKMFLNMSEEERKEYAIILTKKSDMKDELKRKQFLHTAKMFAYYNSKER